MLFSIFSVYIGTAMLEIIDEHKRHIVAISVVLSNFLILGVLKYSNLVVDAVNLIGFKSGHSGEVMIINLHFMEKISLIMCAYQMA